MRKMQFPVFHLCAVLLLGSALPLTAIAQPYPN